MIESLPTFRVEREEIAKITLCGSTRFKTEYELWNRRLSMAGFLVYSVSCFGHSGDPLSAEEKERLDRVHLAKIDASHAIVVINPGGYIGESTRNEIRHAESTDKDVYYLEGGRTIYQLRTGPEGAGSLRYRAFNSKTGEGRYTGEQLRQARRYTDADAEEVRRTLYPRRSEGPSNSKTGEGEER